MCAHVVCIHVYIYIPCVFSLLALPANPRHTSFMISSGNVQAGAFAT